MDKLKTEQLKPPWSNKIKLMLRTGSSSKARPSFCLCKPPSVDPSSRNHYSKKDYQRLDISSSENPTTEATEQLTNVDKKNENCESKADFIPKLQRMNSSCSKRTCICGICLQQFSSASLLEIHRKQSGHYLCSNCGEAFNNSVLLQEHAKDEQCKMLSCSVCDGKFMSDEEISTHKTKEHFWCSECKKFFLDAERLSIHRHCRPGDTNPVRCLECDKTFRSHSRYKTHMMATHTGERPFVCPECGSGFSRMYGLSKHMKYTHSDEKKFECEFCHKTFKRKDHMQKHLITHSSKKPFSCENCGQGFNQRVSLKKHLPCKIQTQQTDTKAIGDDTQEREKQMKKCDMTEINELTENGNSNGSSEIQKRSEKSGENYGNNTPRYLGCRCPPSCSCKKFTIALNVNSQNSKSRFKEVASLSCCYHGKIEEAIAKKDH